VAQTAARLKEAAKLGFARAILPQGGSEASAEAGLSLEAVTSLSSLVADIAARGRGARAAAPSPQSSEAHPPLRGGGMRAR
jgi:DNA repair protein RadA/Sms